MTVVSRLLGIALLLYFAVPRVQALLRPKSPPTESMREAASRLAPCGAAIAPPEPPAVVRSDRDRLLAEGFALCGKPYEWGAKGPDKYDCSGFTKAAYAAGGVRLPDGSFNQARGERPLGSLDELRPGDLLFYRWAGEEGVSHVTLYVGEGWAIGTGSPGQPAEVTLYPLVSDFQVPDTIVTYRHIEMPDGS